jgi:hypothetical protein
VKKISTLMNEGTDHIILIALQFRRRNKQIS